MAEYDRYFSCARDLKLFSKLQTEKQQARLREFNNYELGVFASYLAIYLDSIALKTPNLTTPRNSLKRIYNNASNMLQSIVEGLSDKYISKEIARQELIKVSGVITEIEHTLKRKGKKLKEEHIVSVKIGAAATQFKPIDIADLGKYLKDFEAITKLIDPIAKQYAPDLDTNNKALGLPPPVVNTPPETEGGNPFASPSRYGQYLDNFSQKHHDAFAKAAKQIKIPTNIGANPGQTLWTVAQLPIYVDAWPALKEPELDRAGIDYYVLSKTSILLFKQMLLVVYTKQNSVDFTNTELRAKQAIREQYGKDYLYSKPFLSKEVNKPYTFYWIIAASTRLSQFKINSIGIAYTPELNKLENLTNDTETIRQNQQKELQNDIDRAKANKQAAQPLFEQYENIKTQLKQLRKVINESQQELDLLNVERKQQQQALNALPNGSQKYKEQYAKIVALDSRIAIVQDTLRNNRNVVSIGLRQKLDKLMDDLRDFAKVKNAA